jgi:hypothetical protein
MSRKELVTFLKEKTIKLQPMDVVAERRHPNAPEIH